VRTDLSGADLPQRGGSEGAQHPRTATLHHFGGGYRDLLHGGDSLLGGQDAAGADLRSCAGGVAAGLRGGNVYRIHGAAGAGPYHPRREDLPQGDARLQTGTGGQPGGTRLPERSRSDRQGGGVEGDGDLVRCGDPFCRKARTTGRSTGFQRKRRKKESRTIENRRGVPVGTGTCAAEPVGGDTNVLVRAPGHHHRIEWLGRDEPRPFRPAPGAVL